MTQERALYWLATVGSGEITGLVKMNPKMENLGGELDDNYLVAVANSNMPESRRSLAIRALGLARKPEIGAEVVKWTTDPSGQVRAAATVVLADYPALATPERLGLSGADLDFNVRVATAQCIGFGQINAGVKFLATMLGDSNLEVRKAAAQSLLSFSPRDAEVASALKANLGSHDFGEVFMIALARIDPETYRFQPGRPRVQSTARRGAGGSRAAMRRKFCSNISRTNRRKSYKEADLTAIWMRSTKQR
jgi:HEAT repeat protein